MAPGPMDPGGASPVDRTFEAVLISGTCLPGTGADPDPGAGWFRARVLALCSAGVHLWIVCPQGRVRPEGWAEMDRRWRVRPEGPGRLHVCCSHGSEVFEVTSGGPVLVCRGASTGADGSGPVRFAARWLAERGITGRLVLVVGRWFGEVDGRPGPDAQLVVDGLERAVVVSVGDEGGAPGSRVVHVGGGGNGLKEVLDLQLARRAARRLPQVDDDPAWTVKLPTAVERTRAAEALGALSNGWSGTRGSLEEEGPGAQPLFALNGVFTADGALRHGPSWTRLDVAGAEGDALPDRLVDMRSAVLVRRGSGAGLSSVRFASAVAPHALAMRVEAPWDRLGPEERRPPAPWTHPEITGTTPAGSPSGPVIAVAAEDRMAAIPGGQTLERLAAWATSDDEEAARRDVAGRLAVEEAKGFDGLLSEHRAAWARRWADADVVVGGDLQSQVAVRFALFHLLSCGPDDGEAAVGARGLTGDAYSGHVFWDTDVFVLPVLAAVAPRAARTMLEYRIRRLPAARAAARSLGMEGARFPWESAATGEDVTPLYTVGRDGERIPIRTGRYEEHIVADVAWAANCYAEWSGDAAFLAGPGRDLLVETARYWASRIQLDGTGRGHLFSTMGPDEYHEVVDDNAFTNVMARWNLRRAADLLGPDDVSGEGSTWRALAAALVDGWVPEKRVYEQFAGYFDLEPLLMSQVAAPPVSVDVLLGPERVAGSQLIKQADVLMLHHLVPGEVRPGSLQTCLAYYEPRTAHGSSLSPAVHASLLARAGRPDPALDLFRLACRLDFDDITGTTSGGLHFATMGGVWQAVAYGFMGLRALPGVLGVDPHLPSAWSSLTVRLRFAGDQVEVRAGGDSVEVGCEAPLRVQVGAGPPVECRPPGRRLGIRSGAEGSTR